MGIKSLSISIILNSLGSNFKIYSVNRPSPGPISIIFKFFLGIKLQIFFNYIFIN